MMKPVITFSRYFGYLALAGLLAACTSGAPTETMRKIDARSGDLQPLTAGKVNDVRAAVHAALLLDPRVREQASLTGASVDQIAVEQAALFPSLSFGVVGGLGAAGAGDPDLELSGEQLLVDFGGTKRAIEAADINLQIQYLMFQAAVDNSAADALISWRQVGMLEELVAVKRAQFTAMSDLHGLIAERQDIGAASAPDLLETRNRMERAEFELLDARLELSEARDKLQRLTGTSQGGTIPDFSQNCTPPGGETDMLQIAQLELIKARLNLESAARARYPSISLNPLGRVSLTGGNVSSGLNINLGAPLFQGGAIRAKENAARNRRASAEAMVEAEERNIRLDELRLQRQISSLGEKQAMLTRQIETMRQTRDLYRSQYIELGSRQITDLFDVEETLYGRQAELVEAKFNLQERLVECAARSKAIRNDLGLTQFQLYGYPLTVDGF